MPTSPMPTSPMPTSPMPTSPMPTTPLPTTPRPTTRASKPARTRPRALATGLATAALTSIFALSAPAAHADDVDDRGCGQPAMPATFQTIFHAPEYRQVPAITHQEWRWTRDVATYEYEFTTEVSPARAEADWRREIPNPPELRWKTTVIDQPSVPAVPGTEERGHHETRIITPAVYETEYEYRHVIIPNLVRWRDAGWAAAGWMATGNTREVEITPAVTEEVWVVDVDAVPGTPAIPEESHEEFTWAAESPGAGWSATGEERAVDPTVEETTTDGGQPLGSGWVLLEERRFPAVYDTVWAPSAPGGYDPTGNSRVASTQTEETEETSAREPAGEGWSKIESTETTVIDEEATEELVRPGWTEQIELTPPLPATEPCVLGPAPTEPAGSDTEAEVAGPAQPGPGTDRGDDAGSAAAPPGATVLPNTGGAPGWMAPAGLAVLTAGAVLAAASRRSRA